MGEGQGRPRNISKLGISNKVISGNKSTVNNILTLAGALRRWRSLSVG